MCSKRTEEGCLGAHSGGCQGASVSNLDLIMQNDVQEGTVHAEGAIVV